MYFYLGEKVPWLLVHQVWAFLPLAGAQLARTFGPRGRWWSRAVAATALAATLTTSLVASFVLHEISPRRKRVEALVYVQTCPELLPVVREARQLAAGGANPAVAVAGEAGWPLTWYWRDAPVWWDAPQPGMHPPLVLCDPHKEAEIRLQLGPGYTGERIPLRAWWPPPDDFVPGPTDLLRYVLGRLPWSVIGSADVIVLRRSEEPVASVREAPVPESLASELGVRSAKVLGEQWLAEPRGVAVAADGTVAVADPGLSAVLLFDDSGGVQRVAVSDGLSQPEAVAWAPEGALVIADTWGHRVLVHLPSTAGSAPLPDAPGGWYGPRGVAVAADGTVAVSDTGSKRVVAFARGAAQVWTWGKAGTAPGELEEPVGLAWIDNDRLLVCDTGNRRVQVLDREGRALRVVELPAAWSDFYARPQVAVIAEDLWVVTDPPAESLFLVRGETVTQLDLGGDGIQPAGVAWHEGKLYLSDLNRRLWVFEVGVE